MEPEVEADDVIGTLALQGSDKGFKVFIASGDKDMAQLVSSEVTVIDDQKNSVWDEKGVLEKFGVKANQIVDYLTLVGDSSDNIPGIRGVGLKTLHKRLPIIFGDKITVDDIVKYANEHRDEAKVLEIIADSKELLDLNYMLMQN